MIGTPPIPTPPSPFLPPPLSSPVPPKTPSLLKFPSASITLILLCLLLTKTATSTNTTKTPGAIPAYAIFTLELLPPGTTSPVAILPFPSPLSLLLTGVEVGNGTKIDVEDAESTRVSVNGMLLKDSSGGFEGSGSGMTVPGNPGSVDVVVEVDIVVCIGSMVRRSDVGVDDKTDRMVGTGAAFVSDMVEEVGVI